MALRGAETRRRAPAGGRVWVRLAPGADVPPLEQPADGRVDLRSLQRAESIVDPLLAAAATAAAALWFGYMVARTPALALAGVACMIVALAIAVRPRFGLALLLVIGPLPLGFATGGDRSLLGAVGGTTVNGVILTTTVVVLVFVLLARRRLVWALAAFALPVFWVVWSTLTLLYTDWPDEGVRLAFKLWFVLLVGMLTYYVCQSSSGMSLVRRWWYVGYAVSTVLGLYWLGRYGIQTFAAGNVYAYGPFRAPNPFAFYWLATLIFAGSLWASERRRLDLLVAVTAGIQAVATQTRIAIAALVVVLLLMVLLEARRGATKLVGVLVVATMVVGMLVALVTFPALQYGVFFGQVDTVGEAVSTATANRLDTQGRDRVWSAVYEGAVSGSPIVGQGIGSSTRFFQTASTTGMAGVVHNEYLRVFYEQGLVGLVMLLAVLALSVAYLAARYRHARGLERDLLAGAIVGVVAYAIIAITDNAMDYYAIFGQFIAVTAGAALAQRASRRRDGQLWI